MRTIEVVTEIDAPTAVVWSHLCNTSVYADWNPFITTVEGELAVGERLVVRVTPPGGRAMTFRPIVTAVEHETRLAWFGRLGVPAILDGRHSFDLLTTGEGRTRLTQTEEFRGVLVPLMGGAYARTQAGFESMNEALRRLAEGAPTGEPVDEGSSQST